MAVEDLNLTQMEVAAEDIIEGPDTQVPTVELPPSYSVDGVDVSAEQFSRATGGTFGGIPVEAPPGVDRFSRARSDLYAAVEMVESGGDVNAVSPKGAVGPMQLMPATAKNPGYGITPAQNDSPTENRRVGREYLDAMLNKYQGNLDFALAAYNWGPGNTDQWVKGGGDKSKLPKETRDYLDKVNSRVPNYGGTFGGIPADVAPEPISFDSPQAISENNRQALNTTIDLTSDDPGVRELNDIAKQNNDSTMSLAELRFGPEQIEKWQNDPIGFKEAYRFLDPQDLLPGGGLYKGYEALSMAKVVDKVRKKEDLTDSEEKEFAEYVDLQLEKNIRGFTWGGGMAYYGSPMPAFIAEFMVTAGLAKTAQVGAVAAVTKGVMVAAETAALARYTGYAARAAAQTTAFVPMSVRNFGDLELNARLQITEKGHVFIQEANLNPVTTFLKAYAYTGAEVASELSGRKLGTYVINPIARRLVTPANTMINKLPPKLVTGLINMYKKIKPNARVSDILTRAGWHGLINELGEERVADALRLYTDFGFGDDISIDDIFNRMIPDQDQFLIELGILSVMGGAKTGYVAVANMLEQQGVSQEEIASILENLTDEELENIIVNDTYIEINPSREQALEEIQISFASEQQQQEAAKNKVDEDTLQIYEENIESNYQKIIDKQVIEAERKVKKIRKESKKIKVWIAEGGPLEIDQLIYYGFDQDLFYNYDQIGRNIGAKRSPVGKNFQRLWTQKGGQSISDLTQRWNEEYNTWGEQEVTDTEMAELLQDMISDANFSDQLLNREAEAEIQAIESSVESLYRIDGQEQLEEYFNQTFRDILEYNDLEVPIIIESSNGVETIENAQTVSEAEFHNLHKELQKLKLIGEGIIRDDMYAVPDRLYDTFLDDQPEMIDQQKPSIDHTQSSWVQNYVDWINKFEAVENTLKLAKSRGAPVLPGTDTKLLISSYMGIVNNIKVTLNSNTTNLNAKGHLVKSGPGLKPIIDGFDNLLLSVEPDVNVRNQDLDTYLIARRIQQDLQNYTIPGVQDFTQVESEAQAEQAEQAGIAQETLDDLSMQLQEKYDLSAAEVVVKEIEGSLYVELDGKITQDTLNDIYEFADQSNIDLVLNVDSDAYVDGKRIADGTIPGAETALSPKGAFVYGLKRSPEASTKVPELAGPPQKLVGAVQPEFAKDKKFVGPVVERRVSEEQAMQAEMDLLVLQMKYGDNMTAFEIVATDLYKYQQRLLKLLVQSGNISQDTYNDIVDNNKNYVPMQRVLMNDFLYNSGFNKEQISTVLNVLSDSEVESIIDTAVITQDQYNRVITNDPKTIQLLEKLKSGAFVGKGLFNNVSSQQILKKFVGSDLAVKNTVNSIISNTGRIIDVAYRNRVARSLVNLAEWVPEQIQKVKPTMVSFNVDGKKVMRPLSVQPAGTILVYRDGKKEYYEVSKPLLEAMDNLHPAQISTLEQILIAPVTIFRLGTTMTPTFVQKNVLRDALTSYQMSDARPTPIDIGRAIIDMIGDKQMYEDWQASGGSMGTYMDLSDTGIQDAYTKLFKNESYVKQVLKTGGLKLPYDLAKAAEETIRLSVFIAAKRKGMSDIEGGYEARQATVDFMRSGIKGKVANRRLPFLNATIQAQDKLMRTFKKSPLQTSAIMLATITVPSILITGYYLYQAPDDERQEYLDIPMWVRDINWVYKSNGEWNYVPKNFTPGYIFGSIAEKLMVWGYEGDKPEFKGFYNEIAKGAITSMSPISDPSGAIHPLLKLALEMTADFNFFQKRAIYPEYMKKLEPELRMSGSTSATAQAVGEKFNVSPAVAEHVARGLIGSSAGYVTDAGDYILQQVAKYKGEPFNEPPTNRRNQELSKVFTVETPTGMQSRTVMDFFDVVDLVMMKSNSVDRFVDEEREEYQENNAFLLSQKELIVDTSREISDLSKYLRTQMQNPEISGDEKAIIKEETGVQINELARNAMRTFNENLAEF